MAGTLHRLVYFSRNRIDGGAEALAEAVEQILAVSKRNNAAAGITGALMFNAGCFGQVLEGDRAALLATFAQIQRDPRHDSVSLLSFEPIGLQSFGHWSMGFVGQRPVDAAAFAHVGPSSGFDPSQASGDTLLGALRDLAISDEARAKGGTASG